jgi:RNA polymerase sigma-70 factor (ECF subfamily)
MTHDQSVPKLRLVHRAPPSITPAPVDPRDLDGLYRRFSPYVAAVAVRLLGRDSELDDLVQDVFLQAMRGISQLRDPDAVKGWLAKVTVRLAVRRLRKRRLLQALHRSGVHDEYLQLAAAGASPDQRALLAKVYQLLDRLPASSRVIWLLRHALGEPLAAVVELSGFSQSTVQRRLREVDALLAKELNHD